MKISYQIARLRREQAGLDGCKTSSNVCRMQSGGSVLASIVTTILPLHRLWSMPVVVALLAALSIAVPGRAQSSAAISGTVTDISGALIPGADVFLTNVDTRAVQQSKTGSAGTYSIIDIRPGNYTVKVTKPDFETVDP